MDRNPSFAEKPSSKILLGPAVPGPQRMHELQEPLEFNYANTPAKAFAYNFDHCFFYCHYVRGSRDGEKFELSMGQMASILGIDLNVEVSKEMASQKVSPYTADVVRQQTRGLVSLIIFLAIAAGVKWHTERSAPQTPNPPAIKAPSDPDRNPKK